MAKGTKTSAKVEKVTFGKRRNGKAKKRVNKHLKTKRTK
jgi:hypothetical protein